MLNHLSKKFMKFRLKLVCNYVTMFFQFFFSVVRLESNHFKADTSIGVKELAAVENFTGRPFVIQFGCQFMGEAPSGNFGSVFVEQPSQYGGNQPILSFLLNKVCSKKIL